MKLSFEISDASFENPFIGSVDIGADAPIEEAVERFKDSGRALRPEETVHHLNGLHADYRIENLELFASRHPPGQRVQDLVAFAITLLRDYPEEASLQGVKLLSLESDESTRLLQEEGLTFSDVLRAVHSDILRE